MEISVRPKRVFHITIIYLAAWFYWTHVMYGMFQKSQKKQYLYKILSICLRLTEFVS